MLSYAFQTLNQGNYDDLAVESFDEMYDLLAAILAKGIGIQLKQGLYREYINRQEELPVMRGKINMTGTIKNRLSHELLLTCDFDELSENNLLNQILKTTVMLLLKNAKVKAEYKDDLKKKMLFFSNVDMLELTSIRWSAIRFQRNNQTYRMLVSICQLIIEGMLITTDSGGYRLASFADEQRNIQYPHQVIHREVYPFEHRLFFHTLAEKFVPSTLLSVQIRLKLPTAFAAQFQKHTHFFQR